MPNSFIHRAKSSLFQVSGGRLYWPDPMQSAGVGQRDIPFGAWEKYSGFRMGRSGPKKFSRQERQVRQEVSGISGASWRSLRPWREKWAEKASNRGSEIRCRPGPPTGRDRAAWGHAAYNEEEQPPVAGPGRIEHPGRRTPLAKSAKFAKKFRAFRGLLGALCVLGEKNGSGRVKGKAEG